MRGIVARSPALCSAMTAVVSWAGSEAAGCLVREGRRGGCACLQVRAAKRPAAVIGRRGACPRILVRCGTMSS